MDWHLIQSGVGGGGRRGWEQSMTSCYGSRVKLRTVLATSSGLISTRFQSLVSLQQRDCFVILHSYDSSKSQVTKWFYVCIHWRFMALQVIREHGGSVSFELINSLIVVRTELLFLEIVSLSANRCFITVWLWLLSSLFWRSSTCTYLRLFMGLL